MSLWTERILGEFPPDLARFWIAADPDDVLLDEHILSELRSRGFEVLPFEDCDRLPGRLRRALAAGLGPR